MLKLKRPDYDRAFAAQLAGLDPQAVYDLLGENAVLLCWEAPGEGCHRRIVAEWLEAALVTEVPEFGFPRDQTPTYAETPWKSKAFKPKAPSSSEARHRRLGRPQPPTASQDWWDGLTT
jgi:hypothetical protein